jgi:hypothetical protein
MGRAVELDPGIWLVQVTETGHTASRMVDDMAYGPEECLPIPGAAAWFERDYQRTVREMAETDTD